MRILRVPLLAEEITVELRDALQHRLDEAVMILLSGALIRNPNCKLTKEDVQVLQPDLSSYPSGQQPSTEDDQFFWFQCYDSKNMLSVDTPVGLTNFYIYNRALSAGKKGIYCNCEIC